MQPIKQALRPDWRKTLLFAIFALIAAGGHIQSWAFSDVPPKPPLYELLRPLPIWPMWMYLLLPLFLLSSIGLNVMPGHFWLFVATNVLYFYLLSCLLVVGFDRYKSRFPKWLWAIIIIAPLALQLWMTPSIFDQPPSTPGDWMEAMLYFFSTSPVGSLYLYLLACLGFFVYDGVKRARA